MVRYDVINHRNGVRHKADIVEAHIAILSKSIGRTGAQQPKK